MQPGNGGAQVQPSLAPCPVLPPSILIRISCVALRHFAHWPYHVSALAYICMCISSGSLMIVAPRRVLCFPLGDSKPPRQTGWQGLRGASVEPWEEGPAFSGLLCLLSFRESNRHAVCWQLFLPLRAPQPARDKAHGGALHSLPQWQHPPHCQPGAQSECWRGAPSRGALCLGLEDLLTVSLGRGKPRPGSVPLGWRARKTACGQGRLVGDAPSDGWGSPGARWTSSFRP